MLPLRRSVLALACRSATVRPIASRTFTSSFIRHDQQSDPLPGEPSKHIKKFNEIKTEEDLLPPGAEPGTIPTDIEQATGLDRLEILGKMQGIDIFDMKPLDASRRGTLDNPIVVRSAGDEQYCGCTGSPADSHVVKWLTLSRDRPVERCIECGSVYQMEYVGPAEDPHGHGHGEHDVHGHDADGAHNYEGEPKTMADFVNPEYR
ncbi:subunit IV of cytochrome c oxidase [Viridothelium virens]|uniref:Cytochrome c oxidase subunit 4, mitochondrial n=1 Tax=Viridothelium virens TaxID=1048519 RepID=A0A6A6HEY6_VIRVR|nr:subunit IV of cytochrome c oxidase [Viridothelium virens]